MFEALRIVALVVVLLLNICVGCSANNCTSNSECEERIGTGSECGADGLCSESRGGGLFDGGCLYQRLPGWNKKRVCNSDDPPGAAEESDVCRISAFDYMEIRIASQDWEAVFFEAYLLQILLSELLDVPTTLENGTPDAKLDFYDPNMPFDYGSSVEFDALGRADEVGDCREASRSADSYEVCAHFIPEHWSAHNSWFKERVQDGLVEPPQGLGIVGEENWFVPVFTLDRDPSLATYLGLRGEENRRKLAETFKRPTKWKDYCDSVSPNLCATPTPTALRYPREDEGEEGSYFAPDLYTGHFRKTDKGDCDKNPTTCTGHIVDYPCGWPTYTQQIIKHLGIALESNGDEPGSGGFSYSEMVQIIKAANATKSNLIVQWWKPEALFNQLIGSDAELQEVALPSANQECVEARVPVDDTCSDNATIRTGSPLGVCGEPPNPLNKIVSSGLYDAIYDPSIAEGSRSPAYDVFKVWSINNLQLNQIFEYWFERQQSRGAGRSAREAVCDWVVEHMSYLQDFVPRTYPRVLREEDFNPLLMASTTLAGIATLVVLFAGLAVFRRRNRRVIKAAQIEFLWLVLAGLFTLSLGAMFAVFPTDGTCMAAMWLVNFGYTFEIVPLIVKVAAINRLMNAAKSMRRVVLQRESLFGAVAVINGLVVILLVCGVP